MDQHPTILPRCPVEAPIPSPDHVVVALVPHHAGLSWRGPSHFRPFSDSSTRRALVDSIDDLGPDALKRNDRDCWRRLGDRVRRVRVYLGLLLVMGEGS